MIYVDIIKPNTHNHTTVMHYITLLDTELLVPYLLNATRPVTRLHSHPMKNN